MRRRPTLGLSGCACALLTSVPAAWAQDTDPAIPAASGLEEVVVTAQRREERLQDVPISVTALGGDRLTAMRAVDISSAVAFVPNVSFGTGAGDPTDVTLSIRGIQTPGAQLVQDSAVPLYVDGVYRARTAGSNAATVDLERLEVLRGPQGTLFGRNTVGGAVSITTRQPVDVFEGSLTADIGDYQTRNITGIVNVPIAEVLATRFVYQHVEHDGFGEGTTGRQYSSLEQDYFRAGLSLELPQDWQALFAADYFDASADTQLVRLAFYNAASPLNAVLPSLNGGAGDLLSNYVNRGGYRDGFGEALRDTDIESYSFTGTVSGRLAGLDVKSITGYQAQDSNRPIDLDGTPYPLINLPDQPTSVHQISQEIQAFGNALGDRLQWITGLYYFREDGSQQSVSQALAPVNPTLSVVDYDATNTSSAAFVQVNFNLTAALKLTSGARYTEDKREIVYHDRARNPATGVETCVLSPAVQDPGAFCNASGDVDFNYVPWTLGLDFQLSDTALLYAKVSKGFRSGGYSQSTIPALAALTTVDPEEVLSPEVGFKLELLDRRLRLNAAAFYAEYTDIQQQIRTTGPGGIPVAVQVNAGEGTMVGGEIELMALIADRLTLNAGVGLLDSEYTLGPFDGTPFLYAPKRTLNFGASYPVDFGAGQLLLNADYGYKSRQYYVSPGSNPQVNAALQQPGYGVLNAQAKFTFARNPVTVAIWGRNLTDEEFATRILDFSSTAVGAVIYMPGDPRTIGVSLGYSF